jgi:hypothetical protein
MTVRCSVLPAVRQAGADIVDPGDAEALIWTHAGTDPRDVRAIIDANPGIHWIHLGPVGIERWIPYLDPDRI